MYDNYYAVIMAGGGGTRLWPLSNRGTPKQMLSLVEDCTLFQLAISRLQGVFPPERILVVTVREQAGKLQAQWPEIPAENYLIEPLPRGTASVVGLAAVALQQRCPGAVMAVLTADHFIKEVEKFRRLLEAAYQVANQDYLVTLGIEPTFPSTGYGYIQRGDFVDAFAGFKAYRVLRFKEKPNETLAKELIERGDHDWNSGMFIWRVERILAEIEQQMPELSRSLQRIATAWGTPGQEQTIEMLWPAIQAQTIDYGIMEGARQVAVLAARNLGWSDVGSWDSLFDVLPGDEHGNIALAATHIALDTDSTLVASDSSDRLVVTIGVQNLVIIDAGDALLVCTMENAQRVRQVVGLLKEKGLEGYL